MVYALRIQNDYPYTIVATPLDGDFSKVKLVDDTWDGGDIPSSLYSGRRVETGHLPTRMKWTGGRYKLPDFDRSGSHTGLSERAKTLIESFEPDVHQFVPVDYYDGKGKWLELRYFLFVCNRIDSLDQDKTTLVLRTRHVLPEYAKPGREWYRTWVSVFDLVQRGETDLIPPHLAHDTKSKFVFNRAQIGSHHMWCDKFVVTGPMLSDELAHAVRVAGLTGVNLNEDRRIETV